MISVCRAGAALLLVAVLFSSVALAQQAWKVGAASRNIIPLVNGKNDYVVPVPRTDCCSPGTFVYEFDVGNVPVGNGAADCHWVRDNLYARAAAIGPDAAGRISIFVSVEVYMIFRNDLQDYYNMVKEIVGEATYDNLLFFVHAQHNHEGPDTSGLNVAPINHDYFHYMLEQMANATAEAIYSMEEANLYYGETDFWYGLGDDRDPLVQDGTVRVMQAFRKADTAREQPPIATFVTWAMHPEVTLGFDPTVPPEDCANLPIPEVNCSADGRYFTHDYPGWVSEILAEKLGGGEVLYFNGAIGVQIGANGYAWRVEPGYPLGNGSVVPDGATIVPENFRKAYDIGNWLATYVYENLKLSSDPIPYGEFEYNEIVKLARVTNFFFRVGLVPQTAVNPLGLPPPLLNPNYPLRIGNTMRPAYICPEGLVNPSPSDCQDDGFAYLYDSVSHLPFRVGNWMETEMKYIKIGPLRIISIPGELAPELITGLPKNFDSPEGREEYYASPEFHAVGAEYVMPGALSTMLGCSTEEPCWFWGLTQDEIGYMFPISDWRIKCVQDAANCTKLWEKGALAFEDSASGYQCKNLTDYPQSEMEYYVNRWDQETFEMINATCVYGQMYGEAHDHYEETNSASWDAASIYVEAVAELFGISPSGRYCDTLCHSIEYVCCK